MARQGSRSATEPGRRIAIIGAGYSGTLTALHLLQHCGPSDRVLLYERRESFGRGLAYSTEQGDHVLNVRAMNMSAFPERPAHFLDWLRARSEHREAGEPLADRFVPRALYGLYLQELLREAIARYGGRTLELVHDEATDLTEVGRCVRVRSAGGGLKEVDAVVLACGSFPPAKSRGAYRGNPWAPNALGGIDPDEPVLILGTGLTMVDVALSLFRKGHRGIVYAMSRRGLLPRRHRGKILPDPVELETLLEHGVTVSRILRAVRARIREAASIGLDWRCVIDGLRPHTEALWGALAPEEKSRFLRHLRPWWDAHRHRMAPPAADAIESARADGRLNVFAGRVVATKIDTKRVVVTFRRKGAQEQSTLGVAALIDCTGLKTAHAASVDPLLRGLIDTGKARLDQFDLGLDVDPATDGVIDGEGIASRRLFAVGPLTRGAHWEIIAVPDLRVQCERMARHLLATVRARELAKPKAALAWLGM